MYYPTSRDLLHLARACRAAENSQHRCRHGAVIRRGSRITIGWNKIKNDPRYTYCENSIHAEHDALRKHPAPKKSRCYSVRLDKNGNLAYAAPCLRCQTRLDAAGVKSVVYTDPNSITGYGIVLL